MMFSKENAVDQQLKVRLEKVEEDLRELRDPEYAEGKRILKLEKIVNPGFGLGFLDTMGYHYSVKTRAEMARKISDYYRKLETDLLKIIKDPNIPNKEGK